MSVFVSLLFPVNQYKNITIKNVRHNPLASLNWSATAKYNFILFWSPWCLVQQITTECTSVPKVQ